MKQRGKLCLLVAILILPGVLAAQTDDLLTHVWAGVQQSHTKFTTICGTVTETRTSKLIAKPMVLHGRFCAEGSDRFMLEYSEPSPMSIRLNGDSINITADGRTEVMNIGGEERRAESDYASENSIDNLKKKFTVTAEESSRNFELRLVPRAQGMRHRLNYLVIKLDKQSYLPRSVEVDGKSGVNSVFIFDITSENTKLPEDTFEVMKTK